MGGAAGGVTGSAKRGVAGKPSTGGQAPMPPGMETGAAVDVIPDRIRHSRNGGGTMKYLFTIIAALAAVSILSAPARADSPITSTPFHEAYFDLAIVRDALGSGVLDLRMAQYLSSPDVPIDAKVAVINALGWDIEGKHNAELFASYLALSRGWSLYEVDEERLAELTDDELCCLGYLAMMDDYFHPEEALPLLELANEFKPESLTIRLIYGLAKAQVAFDGDWAGVWPAIDDAFGGDELVVDMRPAAVDIILEYMSLYEEYVE
ncbi:hypothetical protein J7J84_02600 [bacterium]|nr:hypothetical protein [bacterium]